MIKRSKGFIRVLVVEDSPTAAMALKTILDADHGIAVIGIAKDGREAIKLIHRLKPDLITMDVHLPLMDGLEVTKQIMASRPTPILILSSSSFTRRADKVFHAISYGALDVANKGDILSRDGHEVTEEFIRKIKFLSGMKVIHHPYAKLYSRSSQQLADTRIQEDPERLVAIVGSTGAPEAIHRILNSLPKAFPCGIVIVIHLAHGFEKGFVQWLQGLCSIRIKLGNQGEPIHPGVAYMAPTGCHMRVTKDRTIELGDDPPRSGLRPCGDYLLESVAKHYGWGSIGVILTGMGRDGAIGIQKIKMVGGKTIAQDEETSVIFGMPRAAIETTAVDKALSLNRIPDEIMRLLEKGILC